MSGDLQTILNQLQRARMRIGEGDAAGVVLDELLAHTRAPEIRLRAERPRRTPEQENEQRSTF